MKTLKHIGPLFVLLFAGCTGGESLLFGTIPDDGWSIGSGSQSSSSSSSSSGGGIGGAGGGTAGMGGISGAGGDAVGGMAGTGGVGGVIVAMPCSLDSDCDGVTTECKRPGCVDGYCGVLYVTANKPLAMQVPNDCKSRQCDGQGNVITVPWDDQPIDDGKQCTTDYCLDGNIVREPVAQGTLCTLPNGMTGVCSGLAALDCVECIQGVQGCTGTKTCIGYMCK